MALWGMPNGYARTNSHTWDGKAAGNIVNGNALSDCVFCGHPLEPIVGEAGWWGCYAKPHVGQNANNDSCPRRQSGEPMDGFRLWPKSRGAAPRQENNGCSRLHIEPEQFAERSAIIQERAGEALALAIKHGHKLERILVFNAFAEEPLVVHCNVCDESLTIQQKRFLAMGEEGCKGPILYFDCARLQRKSA